MGFSPKQYALLCFHGFTSLFYKVLEKSISHFCDISVDDYIDYRKIEPAKLLQGFITAKGLHWGYYEEFLGLTATLKIPDLHRYRYQLSNNRS